ncbi:MAG: FdtA/QdtA family cupin domain-containing protein [Myxococcota bacterium]
MSETSEWSVHACRSVELPKVSDPRGNLTFAEGNREVPFAIERVYYLYDVPGGAERGGHAHKALHQLIVPLAGSFDVHLDDTEVQRTFRMNRPFVGLYVCPMIWRTLDNFSSGSVCLVLASNRYSEDDYYREFADFRRARETMR